MKESGSSIHLAARVGAVEFAGLESVRSTMSAMTGEEVPLSVATRAVIRAGLRAITEAGLSAAR